VRLAKADGQSKVRFRFLDTGTSSWFWGIDDLGLYEINTPVITSQPAGQTVSAGSTATFTVVAQSATPLTYHWQHAGSNLSDGGHFSGVTNATLTVSNCETNDAGQYVCVVGNLYGNVSSLGAKLREQGGWTFHARGVMPTSSSPNWASMLMGAGPEQHGITSNEWQPEMFEITPTARGPGGIFPTIFCALREQRPDSYLAVFHD
jgi:hypothetical protein